MASSWKQKQSLLYPRWTVSAILILLLHNCIVKADENCINHIDTEDGPGISGYDTVLLLKSDVQELEDVDTDLYVVVWDEDVGDPTIPSGDEFTDYFDIVMGEMNMTVYVKKSLEGLPDYPDSTTVLKIILQFPDFTDAKGCTLELSHNIQDENTAKPNPNSGSYLVDIREDFPLGVTLYGIEVKVTDNDQADPNNRFSVTTDGNCPLEATENSYNSNNGNPATVQFQLRSALDYETTQTYDCIVDITDHGVPELTSVTNIGVTVVDMADEPPVFTSSYYYTEVLSVIASDDPLSISPDSIKATDGDTGINSPIIYSMTNARQDVDGLSYFTIDPDTGEVRLTSDLVEDILVFMSVSFIVKAKEEQDGSEETAVLDVALPLNNDGVTLHFEQFKYASEILDPKAGEEVLMVKAVGEGSDDVTYSWQSGEDENFSIDSNNGMIETKRDDIPPGSYSLVAVATSVETTPPLVAEAQVKIVVLSASAGDIEIFSSVMMTQVEEGDDFDDTISLVNITTSKEAGSLCITAADPEDAFGKFSMNKSDSQWELRQIEEVDYEEWTEIMLQVKAFDNEDACTEPSTPSQDLMRNEAVVIINVADSNDEVPKFEVPPTDEVIAYPKDTALQSVVGPVITLKATDPDTIGEVTYGLSGVGAEGFQVGSESGAVFVKGKFDCSNGCTFTAIAKDGVSQASIDITVLELDMNHIFTLTMDNMDVSMVDDALQTLSDQIGAQVSKLYVGPSVSATTKGWTKQDLGLSVSSIFRLPLQNNRAKRDTTLSIEVHVYTVKQDGTLMNLDEFKTAIDESDSEMKAEAFSEKDVFTMPEEVDTTGLTVAVAVLGSLLGVVLLTGVGFFIYRRRKIAARRRGPPASPISTLGREYPNQGYVPETTPHKPKSQYDSIDLNGSVKGIGVVDDHVISNNNISVYTSPLVASAARDSPPLFRSTLSQPDPAPSSTSGGLRRTDPGKPEYYGLSSPSAPPSFERTTTTSADDTDSYPDPKPSSSSSSTPKPSSSGLYPTIVTMTHEKDDKSDKLPMKTFPSKDDTKPIEPVKDYETSVDSPSTSKFSGLKGSPPPKRSNHISEDEEESEDEGKSDDEGKKSVAFKVLVDTKEIEAENLGPSQKKAAAKSDAVDILEANKKKLDDDEDDSHDDDEDEDVKL